MKTIAIIPARGGSKRLPNKNILELNGTPLLAYSILYAKKNFNIIDEIYVTTDNDHIKNIALQFGAKIIDRPKEISGDFEPTISALKHALGNINDVENVVLLQPSNPFRPDNLLNDAINIYKNLKCKSLFTVTKNEQKLGKIIQNKYFPFNYEIGQRSQDLDPLYFENGLLYIASKENILSNNLITANAFPFEVIHPFAHVDIDTLEDFEYANFLLLNNKIE